MKIKHNVGKKELSDAKKHLALIARNMSIKSKTRPSYRTSAQGFLDSSGYC